MNLESAIQAHAEWKIKLRSAISTQAQLDAATIAKDNCCPLGQWLRGEALVKYGHLNSHMRCVGAHSGFHREAGKVAQLINNKHYSEAEAALASGRPYNTASNEVGGAIIRLRKEAGL